MYNHKTFRVQILKPICFVANLYLNTKCRFCSGDRVIIVLKVLQLQNYFLVCKVSIQVKLLFYCLLRQSVMLYRDDLLIYSASLNFSYDPMCSVNVFMVLCSI